MANKYDFCNQLNQGFNWTDGTYTGLNGMKYQDKRSAIFSVRGGFFADYINNVARDNIIRPIWTNSDQGASIK